MLLARLGACLPILAAAASVLAQIPGRVEEPVLEDAIAVEVVGRDLVAFRLQGSGRLAQRLELDEEVLFTGSRGRIAVALTTRRALGATPDSSSWQEERYRLQETPPQSALLSQRLGLVLTDQRARVFFGTGSWAETRLGPREVLVDARVGPDVAVVVTSRRALGVGPRGGFFEERLRANEEIASIDAVSGAATIVTSQRTLLFKGPIARWIEHPLR